MFTNINIVDPDKGLKVVIVLRQIKGEFIGSKIKMSCEIFEISKDLYIVHIKKEEVAVTTEE